MTVLRRFAADVLLWLLLSALLPLNGERIDEGPYVNGLVVASLVLAVAVGVRRIAPLASLVLAAGLLVVDVWLAGPFAVLAFLVGRSAVRPRSALRTFAAIGVGGAAAALARAIVVGTDRWVAYYVVAEVVFCGIFPWLVGRYLRQRRELAVGGWALAEELERGQTLVVERARLRERARIAEDMHDALGHELSLIALRAGALELDGSLGPAQRETAAELRAGAAAATERLRAVIGVLRAGADAPLQPAEESLDTLVDRVRRAGLVIDWQVVAQPGADAGASADLGLAPLADRALHRVVQEGLTNATRHAPGTAVTGRLTVGPSAVTVVLSNPVGDPRAVRRSGHISGERVDRTANGGTGAPVAEDGSGLLGLAERVRLAGGTFHTDASDLFTVTATLPRDPAQAAQAAQTDADPAAASGADPAAASGADPAASRAYPLGAAVSDGAGAPDGIGAPDGVAAHGAAGALAGSGPTGAQAAAAATSGRFALARRRTRRGLALTVLVPMAAAVLLVGIVVGGYAIETTGSVLSPADAARLHVGQPEEEARELLPLLQVTERPEVPEPPRPPGAECEYYNTSGTLFPPVRDVYRVCFADGRVAGIDLIPGRTARGGRG
ncbi:sensor histidine kinase [Cryptosporangium minutisporangium]|uniref:sensor histidine kinase n=1 Tax=Cryptosporangium minutisporangium TaxID=113569 RepID=UPI0035E5D711